MPKVFKVRCKGSHGRCKCDTLCVRWTHLQPGFGHTLLHTLEVRKGKNPETVAELLNEVEGL